MPITGEVDISGILAKLGDPTHGLAPKRPAQPDQIEEIFLAAEGAVDMSTCVALACIPKFVWDVNGYYRALDIQWPYKPTKLELRKGFQRVDGHSSDFTTYAMKQLLNLATRAEYDAMPLGSHFYDKYVQLDQMRRLSEVAKEMSEDSDTLITVDDLMEGFDPEEDLESPEPSVGYPWNWGYYTYMTRQHHTPALEKWQALLTAEFARNDIVTNISIGYVGNTEKKFEIHHSDGRDIFLLSDRIEPTTELSQSAVSTYKSSRPKGKHG